jgi:hypothetical protein
MPPKHHPPSYGNEFLPAWAVRVGSQEIVVSAEFGAPALMKLITTFPLERDDIPAFGLRMSPRVSEARQSYYD